MTTVEKLGNEMRTMLKFVKGNKKKEFTKAFHKAQELYEICREDMTPEDIITDLEKLGMDDVAKFILINEYH